ncbi:MAG: hypothetical protein ACREBR_03690, partial [bacterium]
MHSSDSHIHSPATEKSRAQFCLLIFPTVAVRLIEPDIKITTMQIDQLLLLQLQQQQLQQSNNNNKTKQYSKEIPNTCRYNHR